MDRKMSWGWCNRFLSFRTRKMTEHDRYQCKCSCMTSSRLSLCERERGNRMMQSFLILVLNVNKSIELEWFPSVDRDGLSFFLITTSCSCLFPPLHLHLHLLHSKSDVYFSFSLSLPLSRLWSLFSQRFFHQVINAHLSANTPKYLRYEQFDLGKQQHVDWSWWNNDSNSCLGPWQTEMGDGNHEEDDLRWLDLRVIGPGWSFENPDEPARSDGLCRCGMFTVESAVVLPTRGRTGLINNSTNRQRSRKSDESAQELAVWSISDDRSPPDSDDVQLGE